MLSWLRRITKPELPACPSVIAFGKIPAHAEYVRVGGPHAALSEFEAWLAKSAGWASTRGPGAARSRAFERGTPVLFAIASQAQPGSLVAGVLQPSRDAVGRLFPLVLGAIIPAKEIAPVAHLVPRVLRDMFRQARALLPSVASARSPSDFAAMVSSLPPPGLSTIERDAAEYADWLSKVSPPALFEALFEREAGRSAEQAVHTILDAAAPFRGREAPPTSLGVRLPLSHRDEMAPSLWLDVVRRSAGWKATIPSWFARTESPESILVQLGDTPPPSVLADVWDPESASDAVCDLTHKTDLDPARLITPFPPKASALIADPASSLSDLLAQL